MPGYTYYRECVPPNKQLVMVVLGPATWSSPGPTHISSLMIGALNDRELEEASKDLKTEEELIDLATDGA